MFENEKELSDHIPNPPCIHVPVYFTDPKKIHKIDKILKSPNTGWRTDITICLHQQTIPLSALRNFSLDL